MNEPKLKEVYFHKYCPTCAHEKLSEQEQPCAECLEHPGNIDSHKPVKWEEKPMKKTK